MRACGSERKSVSFSKLIAQAAVEALAEGVLLRLARLDILPGDASLIGPGEDRIRGQLRAVIGYDRAGSAAP
jgi:hypothetical protein